MEHRFPRPVMEKGYCMTTGTWAPVEEANTDPNTGLVTNRQCDEWDQDYTYNDFLQPMSLYSSSELLFDRQKNIFKIAMFYLPDQSIITKVGL